MPNVGDKLGTILLLRLLVIVTCLFFGTSDCKPFHNIYVNPVNGSDEDKSCLTANSSEHSCKTLELAFSRRANFTSYVLYPRNQYVLSKEVSFTNLTGLSIMGGNSIITCQGTGVGLAFVNVYGATFDDVAFMYCAATRMSTSKNFQSMLTPKPLYSFNVSLYFHLCTNIMMSWVNVSSSPNATGVVMYDTGGNNTVENCMFSNNTVTGAQAGGGGFYVEFTYCTPGNQNCTDDVYSEHPSISHSHYSFLNSRFANNLANNEGLHSNSTFIVPYKSNHESFGRGSGLCIYLKGKSAYNILEFTNCVFENNSAQWGGGVFLEFHDETASNSVYFNNCTFDTNKCNFTFDTGTGGGGMRLGHYVFGLDESTLNGTYGNRVEFNGCDFTNNSAMYGGGLSISPALQETDSGKGKEAIIVLYHVTFQGNIGKFGSALHVSRFHLITLGVMLDIFVHDTNFINNSVLYADLLQGESIPHTVGIGAVYINQANVIFEGSVLFTNNTGTGLAVAGTSVDFTESSVVFSNNTGYRGGAIALLGSAFFLINEHTKMFYYSNSATDKGGAIYNRYVEMDNLKTHFNCFIRHTDPLRTPNDWGSTFIFINNTDQNQLHNNSIHTSSVRPCAWAGGNGYSANISDIFCWKGWNYQYSHDVNSVVECSKQITSGPGYVRLLHPSHDTTVTAIPGHTFRLPISVTDDFGNDLTNVTVFSSTSNKTANDNNTYYWGGYASVTGLEKSRVCLSLESLGDIIWQVDLMVKLKRCPPGLYPFNSTINNTECTCTERQMYRGILNCDPNSYAVTMNDQNWIGYLDRYGTYLVGICPPGFCRTTNTSLILLPQNFYELDSTVCIHNRTGIMCGECLEGYGPAVNSPTYDCKPCKNITLGSNVVKYVASVYLPLAILFSVLIVFDIRLTTGPANAFILYSQLVSTTFTLDAFGQIPFNRITHDAYSVLQNIYLVIYGIFNLEFIENLLHPFCLSSKFNTLTALSLDYGVAVFPLAMIIATVLCLKLKECCCCSPIKCAKMSTNKLSRWKSSNIREALLPAFAAFILLSYTKFSLTSSYMLAWQPLIDEDGQPVKPYRVYFAGQFDSHNSAYLNAYYLPSIFVSAFVCIIPILFLVYPLVVFEWCLAKNKLLWKFYPVDKVHFFMDTFQGCYKSKMRFFSGLYFLFRLTINAAYIISVTWIQQFVVQQISCIIMITLVATCQPYKRKLLNYVDILIFADLAILNALSLFLYTSSQNGQDPPVSGFVVQYILVFLPLVYMLFYILWYALHSQKWLNKKFEPFTRRLGVNGYSLLDPVAPNGTVTRTYAEIGLSQEDDDELFARAELTNRYRRVNMVQGEEPEGAEESNSRQESGGYGTMSSHDTSSN